MKNRLRNRLGKSSRDRAFHSARLEQLEDRCMLAAVFTYHGGPLLRNVQAQTMYYGSLWNTNGLLVAQKAALDTYVNYIVNSPFMDMMTKAGYNVYRGTATPGVTNGTVIGGVTNGQIQTAIQTQISNATPAANRLAAPNIMRLYIVYVQPGTVITLAPGITSATTFLGYHSMFTGVTATGATTPIYYAVIAYPGPGAPGNFTFQSQLFNSAFEWLTTVASHELAEAVTDPDVLTGWQDYAGGPPVGDEIGDHTNLRYRQGPYLVQELSDQFDNFVTPSTVVTVPPGRVVRAFAAAIPVVSNTKVGIARAIIPAAVTPGKPITTVHVVSATLPVASLNEMFTSLITQL